MRHWRQTFKPENHLRSLKNAPINLREWTTYRDPTRTKHRLSIIITDLQCLHKGGESQHNSQSKHRIWQPWNSISIMATTWDKTLILSWGFCLDFSTSDALWRVDKAFVYLWSDTNEHSCKIKLQQKDKQKLSQRTQMKLGALQYSNLPPVGSKLVV